VQGLYRQAFTALRLFLELTLAAVFYSANELRLIEWMDNRTDINWKRITQKNGGVFTERFARAFMPDLVTEAAHFGSIGAKLYRECSEFVHANPAATTLIPQQLQFDQDLFHRWHDTAPVSSPELRRQHIVAQFSVPLDDGEARVGERKVPYARIWEAKPASSVRLVVKVYLLSACYEFASFCTHKPMPKL
jgi:hypothetical protein